MTMLGPQPLGHQGTPEVVISEASLVYRVRVCVCVCTVHFTEHKVHQRSHHEEGRPVAFGTLPGLCSLHSGLVWVHFHHPRVYPSWFIDV